MTTQDPARERPERAFLIFLLCFYAAWCVRVVVLLPVDGRFASEWARECWSQGLRVGLFVLPVVWYLRNIEKVRAAAFLGLDSFPRGRRLMLGLGIAAGFLALSAVGAWLLQGAHPWAPKRLTGDRWVKLLVGMSFVAFAEEIMYRGLVFRKLRARYSFQRANLLTTALFLLIHGPGWLYMQGPHWGLISVGVSIFIIGWVLGLLMEVTGSLWPPMLLHLANNVGNALLL